jgi:predicted RNA-binding Zn-ribbon protein involved in translation (DUF1610 family)
LDIETAPNTVFTWGLFNQNISLNQIVKPGYTLCWAAKWKDGKEIMFSSMDGDGETVMVQRIHDLLSEADAVVHYNGKRFDIPKLNAEFIKLGYSPPSTYKQIDLLTVARGQFKFASNKLDFVAQHLGIGGKVEHKGMSLWVGCMEGCSKAWRLMERYNKQDVRLLPKLYKKLLPWIMNHPNYALYINTDRPTCTNCGSTKVQSRGKQCTSTQKYTRFQCLDCGKWLMGRKTTLTPQERDNVLKSA